MPNNEMKRKVEARVAQEKASKACNKKKKDIFMKALKGKHKHKLGPKIEAEIKKRMQNLSDEDIMGYFYTGTVYYLPEDNHQSEARYMVKLGELPIGALLTKPVITLAEAKAAKLKEITAERDRQEQAGFEYMGKMFDADSTSVQRLTLAAQSAQLALAASQTFEITWTVQDDTTLTMSAAEMLGFVPAIALHADNLHQEGRRLKDAVNKARTLKAVTAVVWVK